MDRLRSWVVTQSRISNPSKNPFVFYMTTWINVKVRRWRSRKTENEECTYNLACSLTHFHLFHWEGIRKHENTQKKQRKHTERRVRAWNSQWSKYTFSNMNDISEHQKWAAVTFQGKQPRSSQTYLTEQTLVTIKLQSLVCSIMLCI